jgi:aryl-alcohol dehydrogenase-like predicted oxidoreductase
MKMKLKKIDVKTKRLGNTDLCITPVGFGAWAIGGSGWEFGWGEQDDKQSVAAIHRALELGVNWIDRAAVYGMGHSEEFPLRWMQKDMHHGTEDFSAILSAKPTTSMPKICPHRRARTKPTPRRLVPISVFSNRKSLSNG